MPFFLLRKVSDSMDETLLQTKLAVWLWNTPSNDYFDDFIMSIGARRTYSPQVLATINHHNLWYYFCINQTSSHMYSHRSLYYNQYNYFLSLIHFSSVQSKHVSDGLLWSG